MPGKNAPLAYCTVGTSTRNHERSEAYDNSM
jgi:hypothetical protein